MPETPPPNPPAAEATLLDVFAIGVLNAALQIPGQTPQPVKAATFAYAYAAAMLAVRPHP